jgi:hypothetical protein
VGESNNFLGLYLKERKWQAARLRSPMLLGTDFYRLYLGVAEWFFLVGLVD